MSHASYQGAEGYFPMPRFTFNQIGTLSLVILLHVAPLIGFIAFQHKMSGAVIREVPSEIVASLITLPSNTPPQPQPAQEKPKTTPKPRVEQKKPVPKVEPTPTMIRSQDKIEEKETPVEHATVADTRQEKDTVKSGGAPASAAPKTISSSDVQYINAPNPTYPSASRRLREQGEVQLRVLVNARGQAERIDVQKSSGFERLDESAIAAVKRATFKPYMENGQAIPVYAIARIVFNL